MEKKAYTLPRETRTRKGEMVRKFLYIAALSIVATLAFPYVATAQPTTQYTTSSSSGDCSGAAERLAAEQPNVPVGTFESYLNYVSDVDGCVTFEGTTLVASLSVPVYDPDTGEELGIVKDLDPDLTSGAFSITYEEFCGGFILAYEDVAQDYYDQQANSQEQAILDPDGDGDGDACTDEDDAFLTGDAGQGGHLGSFDPNGLCAGAGEQLGLNNLEESGIATIRRNRELRPAMYWSFIRN